jgi:KDO2-lipid IV(A) lauroyltransferase
MSNLRFYINPIYWPVWLLMGFTFLLAQLPYRFLMFCGKYLGLLIFYFGRKMRRATSVNINLCFPELSLKEKNELIRQNFISLGKSIFESLFAFFASSKRLKPLAHMQNEPILFEAKKTGRGIIFMGAHFHTLEIVGRLAAMNENFCIVYREHKIPFVNFILKKLMGAHYGEAIERSNVRALLRALKNGKMVWYTPDIDAGYFNNVFAPFFGVPASSLTATAKLAEKTGAIVLPVAFYRRQDLSGYDMIVHPPLENFPSGNVEKDIARINWVQENLIRKKPEEYLWSYKRFKTRPMGEKRFY